MLSYGATIFERFQDTSKTRPSRGGGLLSRFSVNHSIRLSRILTNNGNYRQTDGLGSMPTLTTYLDLWRSNT
jgi:hypothetical protein